MTKATAGPAWGTRSVGEMRNDFQPVGAGILPGENGDHAGHGARGRGVDGTDRGMGMRRSQHRAIDLAGKIEIVAVATSSGQDAQILLATYRVSDSCLHGVGKFEKRAAILSQGGGPG